MEKEKKNGKLVDRIILAKLFSYIKPYKRLFIAVVSLTILLGVVAPLRPYLIQQTVDTQISEHNYKGLLFMIILMVGILVSQSYVQYLHSYLSGLLGQRVIRDIRTKLFKHITKLPLPFFDTNPIGRLVTRTISDVENLADIFSEGFAAIIADLLQILIILGVMFYTNWKLTLISLSTFPILLLGTYIFKEKIKKTFNEVRLAVANLNAFVQEHISGMSIIQIFNSEKQEMEKFKKINHEHRQATIKSVFYYSIYFPVAEVIGAAGIGFLVWYGCKGVLNQEVTLGMLIAFIMYLQLFFRPIRMIADRFNTLQMGVVCCDRIFKLLDYKPTHPGTGSHSTEHIKGDVTFKHVWFAYEKENYILKNISFTIKAGEKVALVGATGAGKSSIISLLSRFYEINKGSIEIDGVDIQSYHLANLRKSIGVVLQDVFLFYGSIRENITLNNPSISDKTIYHAAQLVGALPFIEKLPGGLDYQVMERGATLSVGQRQLISFIRTFVYNPKIIVLDEATSSVDSETEKLIENALEELMKGRTSLIIAHRLSTIRRADQILVIDKGEIKEKGTHEELLSLQGHYTHLHQMQYRELI